MSNLSDLEKLRQNYLKMVVHTLKENVKKTSDLDLDDFAITHYAMKVEENCLDKSRGVASYTKAITEARLNIERHTSNNTLVPLIAKSMHVDGDDSEVDTVAAKNNNDSKKRVASDDDDVQAEPAKRPKYEEQSQASDDDIGPAKQAKYEDQGEVIVIDSSDSEDEGDTTKENSKSEFFDDDNNENVYPIGEILVSVQTTSSNDNSKD